MAVELSRAPLVARMDADDISKPERLRLQHALLSDHPDAVLAGTLCDGIDEAGRTIRPVDAWRLTRGGPFAPRVGRNHRRVGLGPVRAAGAIGLLTLYYGLRLGAYAAALAAPAFVGRRLRAAGIEPISPRPAPSPGSGR